MSTPTVYWYDDCGSADGWNPPPGTYAGGGGPTTFQIYTGDHHDGAACIELTGTTYTYPTPSIISITKQMAGIVVPAYSGIYSYVFAGWVKVKVIGANAGRSDATGYAEIGVLDASGNELAHFLFVFDNSGSGGYAHLNLPYNGPPVALDESWHYIQMLVTPQRATYYIDRVQVFTETQTRANAPPASIQLTVSSGFGDYGNGFTDIYFGGLNVSSDPTITPQPTYPLSISAGGGGTTDPAPGNYTIETAQTVTITAIPADPVNVPFSNWLVNGVSYTENPLIFMMEQPMIVQAVFGTAPPPPTSSWASWLLLGLAALVGAVALGSTGKKSKKK